MKDKLRCRAEGRKDHCLCCKHEPVWGKDGSGWCDEVEGDVFLDNLNPDPICLLPGSDAFTDNP